MKKLKTALLSTAALLAIAAFASHRPVAAESLNQLIDQIEDAAAGKHGQQNGTNPNTLKTKTPIKHLVVIFNENISFDHYFGTYPNATNVEGEPLFEPARNTQRDINNLLSSPALLTDNNPNVLNSPNPSADLTPPFRLDRTQAAS